MSNRIRHYLRHDVEQLLPLLHETYRCIGLYQKHQTIEQRALLEEQLERIGERLQLFKEHVQPKKQGYFDAIRHQQLSLSDRIIALDIAVGAMHIEFAKPRAYAHQESDELRRVLEASRVSENDLIVERSGEPDVLLQGIPASPGIATGKVAVAMKNSDFRRLPAGSILVTTMTRPEMLVDIQAKVAGIITDIGGSLCHAAIVARELKIPCVVGTKQATTLLKNKWRVCVDGTQGTVRKLTY
jgi:phosphoenolpyruvate synthase/pyruvate phosphate dikinase